MQDSDTYKSYRASEYLSIKHSSYFQVYDELLAPYRGREIVFVEIGVLHGGSLFMWRDYFGPKARIIGIDLFPGAEKWREHGFEIFIGSQSDPEFWKKFFAEVGDIDVLLDDGGHRNNQQILTVQHCLPHVRDGGMIVVEDTHASYMDEFGNPSPHSFVNYCKHIADKINYRFSAFADSKNYEKAIYSVRFFESIVALLVDRRKCFVSEQLSNDGRSDEVKDYRYADYGPTETKREDYPLAGVPILGRLVRRAVKNYRKYSKKWRLDAENKALGRFFD